MPNGSTDIWFLDNKSSGNRKLVHDILLNCNIGEIINVLSEPRETDLFYGLDNAASSIKSRPGGETLEAIIRQIQSMFIELNIAKCPKNPFLVAAPKKESEQVVYISKLITLLRAKFPSAVPLPRGFDDSNTSITLPDNLCINMRALNAVYHSIRASRLQKSFKCQSIVEIGPGLGRTLLNLYKSGEICSGLDIPLSIVGQALFFSEACGENIFTLPGEEASETQLSGKISLYVPSQAKECIRKHALVINIDSLTEIDSDTAKHYVSLIKKHSKLFYSVNHERNKFTVSELFQAIDAPPIFRTMSHWNGYVEEIYTNFADQN